MGRRALARQRWRVRWTPWTKIERMTDAPREAARIVKVEVVGALRMSGGKAVRSMRIELGRYRRIVLGMVVGR